MSTSRAYSRRELQIGSNTIFGCYFHVTSHFLDAIPITLQLERPTQSVACGEGLLYYHSPSAIQNIEQIYICKVQPSR